MEQLSEAAQKQAAKLVLSGFDSRDTGKWLELDATTGTWKYSPQLEAVSTAEQNKAKKAALDTVIKGIDRIITVSAANVSLNGGKTSDLSGYVWSAAKGAASEAVNHVFDYLDKELKEQLYSSMRKDIENNIISADDAAITYLRKTFVESENYGLNDSIDITEQNIIFPIEAKRKVFKQAVDEVLASYEAHKNNARDTAQELFDKSSVLDKEGLKKTDVTEKIQQMIMVDAVRSIMKTLLDAAKKNFYPKEESNESTTDTPSLGWIGNTLYDALKKAVDLACNSLINGIQDGTITGSESLWTTFEENWKEQAIQLLTTALTNIEASEWDKLNKSLDSDQKSADAATFGNIILKVVEIIGANKAGEPTGKKVAELFEMLAKYFITKVTLAGSLVISALAKTKIEDTFKAQKETVENYIKIVDPVEWVDFGFSIQQMYRTWNDAHKGNAAADFDAFKEYQLWEVGSHGIQRGVAGFPSYEDAINPNKTTPDYLVQKVSQILQQLNTESTCTRELLQILSTKSDLKKAVVEHFEKKGMKEEDLKQKLQEQYTTIRRLYDAWSEQQTTQFLDYFN